MNERSHAGRWLLLVPLVAPLLAHAAGGHHAVDDADILPEGACEQESWASRAAGGARLLHAGGACRLGPVQLGAAAEHTRHAGASATAWGLELKWAHPVAAGWSLGLVAQPTWQARARPRYQGTTALALATWRPRDDLVFHANAGRDVVNGEEDEARGGIAAEWMPAQHAWLTVERYREQASHFMRMGVRWSAAGPWSVDLSRAHRLAGPAASSWTIGLSLAFGAD